jgi:trehalose-phosphatase
VSRVESLIRDVADLDRPLLVALDVDGTVSPIVRNPDLAEIPIRTLELLAALARAPEIELALITGRDLSSLRRMEQLEGIWRAVEHGGLVLGPGEEPHPRMLTKAQRDALDRFSAWVEANAQGAFVEHKPQAIALHVRSIAAEDPARAERLMSEADELAERLGLHVRRGKALREAEVTSHDKGRALREIVDRSGARSVLFAGDDFTDFSAIDLASELGIGVFVRSAERRGRPAGAAVVLEGIEEVVDMLEGLLRSFA